MGIAKCTPKRHERFLISHSLERLFRGPCRARQMAGRRKYPNDIRGNEHREGFRSGAPVDRSLCSLEMGERANALEIENRAARGGTPRVIGDTDEQWIWDKKYPNAFGTMNIEGENTRRINAEH